MSDIEVIDEVDPMGPIDFRKKYTRTVGPRHQNSQVAKVWPPTRAQVTLHDDVFADLANHGFDREQVLDMLTGLKGKPE